MKTDNHYTADKIALRVGMTAHLAEIKVLDVFGGHGVVWSGVAKQSGKAIDRVAIDKRLDLDTVHLHGDNMKIVAGVDLTRFDVIDLDAYGIPAELVAYVVREKRFRGIVFVTAIQSMMGSIPGMVAREIGLPPTVTATCPTLVGRRGWEYFQTWLAGLGVDEITHRSKARKHYLGFYANGYTTA